MTTAAKTAAIFRALQKGRQRMLTARQVADLAGSKVTARDVRELLYSWPRQKRFIEIDNSPVRSTKGLYLESTKQHFRLTRAGERYVEASYSQAKEASSMTKHVAIYLRVSSRTQETKSQEPDLERWANAQSQPVVWYRETYTGKTMQRPGWERLEKAIQQGKVSAVVVWRIDRLGRTAKGLTALFDDLRERKVNLVSLKDGLDLSTPAGRLMANVLASVAQYETEVRGERVAAGQAKARAEGKRWGGSKPGIHKRVTKPKLDMIHTMKAKGYSVTSIAAAVHVSRPTVYSALRTMPV